MNATSLLAALVPVCLVAATSAQIQIPINPKATYLRNNNDPGAVPAPGIPLTALGVAPGQWLSIATTGAYSRNGSSDTNKNLVCVFSSNPTLLANAAGLVNRLPGAVAAGPYVVTPNTASSGLTTDIPQDFIVSRTSWATGGLVQVPAGATYLFFSPNENFFGTLSDPNSDFFVVFTPTSPAALQGTAEHCLLRTGVNGTPTETPDVKQASAFSTISVEIPQRWGLSNGDLYVLGANLYQTAGPVPLGPLPATFMGSNFALVQVGITASTPGLWSAFVPPGQAGTGLILQGFFLNDNARNGFLFSSDAHRIELQ